MKLFQEPYAFTDHFNSNPSGVPEKERYLWLSVEPICRYYVKLRYSLLQLLYDAMFEHQFNGLPIARSLVITDSEDSSLLGEVGLRILYIQSLKLINVLARLGAR